MGIDQVLTTYAEPDPTIAFAATRFPTTPETTWRGRPALASPDYGGSCFERAA